MGSTTGVLLVGTRKGVFTVTGDDAREKWSVSDPMFLGHIAQHVMLDPRDGRRIANWPATAFVEFFRNLLHTLKK